MRRYENVPIKQLKPYKNNARTHSEKQIEKIAKSIEEFGFINPVLIDSEYGIIAGHGRVKGAESLGMVEVPCLFVEDLTDEQKRAYIIADNKLALDAGWDYDLLKIELEELDNMDFDITLTGFDDIDFDDSGFFSMDDISEIDGYNENEDDREYFTKTFTFPIEKKNQIICYLKKHQNEIVEQIIKESERDD
jgi:hypothetical protein